MHRPRRIEFILAAVLLGGWLLAKGSAMEIIGALLLLGIFILAWMLFSGWLGGIIGKALVTFGFVKRRI